MTSRSIATEFFFMAQAWINSHSSQFLADFCKYLDDLHNIYTKVCLKMDVDCLLISYIILESFI